VHIAVVCRALAHPGAVASIALRQARELTRHARVTLVSDSFPDDAGWAACARVRMPELAWLRRFRHVPDEVAFAYGARRALRALEGVDFILAHAHSTAHLAARGLGIPFGFFVHGDILERPRGTYDPRLTAFYRWVSPRAYRSADVVFALAPYFADLVRGRGARFVEVVPNGIDLADLGLALGTVAPPVQISSAPHPLRLLSVGRLAVEKGVEHLLAACRLLAPDLDYELTIAGGGVLEAQIQAAAADLPRVRFLGDLPRRSLGTVYRAHDVFVTATLSEAFALVIIEALACGTPVVGTSIDALRAIVHEGENGLLVPPADPAALAAAIERLARDEPLRQRLAARAHDSVIPRYNWSGIGDRIVEVISGIIRRMRG
jgi:glycosyltransferase involved in cell wall biosynthesis